MDRHSCAREELDVEGASTVRVQSSLAQKQRLQQAFFPD
jgi:hypothetical protein